MQEKKGINVEVGAKKYKAFIKVDGHSEQDSTPTPSNPVEIRSVADDVNLLDISNINTTMNGLKWGNNNKEVTISGTATSTYSQCNLTSKDIPAGTYIFSNTNKNSSLKFNVWLFNSNGQIIGNSKLNNPMTITETATSWIAFVEGITSGTEYNETLNFKLQKGTEATSYSEYGKGTVEIKQSGKNLFDKNGVTVGGYLSTKGNIVSSEDSFYTDFIDVSNINGLVSYSGSSSDGGNERIVFYDSNKKVIDYFLTKTRQLNVSNAYYIRISDNVQYLNTIQLEEGNTATDYEPYFSKSYILQTEPLRSLPNEEDGIHRRVGNMILKGDENL